jgi:outer membrane receptor for ferrienterochelin and colicins
MRFRIAQLRLWGACLILLFCVSPTVAGGELPLANDTSSTQPCRAGGVVVDSTGLPVPGVTVLVSGTDGLLVTDPAGRFCLPTLPNGSYEVVAELVGFEPARTQVMMRGGNSPAVHLVLTPSFREDVEVVGRRIDKGLDASPIRTEVVGQETIRALGARSLAEVVEYTTGVRVENNCQNCNFSQIRLLGLQGPYTQILIDGQPVVSSLAQVYAVEQIPARLIERVEVVKGGGSARYGASSVGGVVNVVPREPTRTGGALDLRTESAGGSPNFQVGTGADWVSADRRTFARLFGQFDRMEAIDVDGDGFTEVSQRHFDSVGLRFGRRLLEGGRGKLTGDLMRVFEDRRGGNLLHLPPDETDITEWTEATGYSGAVSWTHNINSRFDYRLTYSTADTRRNSYYGSGGDPDAYGRTTSRLSVLDTTVNHYRSRHLMSWGLQVSDESLNDTQPAYDRSISDRYSSAGVFFQDDWTIAPRLQLMTGIRADRHSALDHLIASPRLGLMYSPRDAFDVRLSFARGFRAPQVFDEDLHIIQVGGEAVIIRHDSDLREERSSNYMAGFEWKPVAGRGQALLEANGFYTRLTDLFFNVEHPDPQTQDLEFLKLNLGGARVYGLELNSGWGIGDRLILQGGIVVQRSEFDDEEPDFGSREFFRTPRVYGNLSATWRHDWFGMLFTGIRHEGRMRAPHYAGFIPENRLELTPMMLTWDASYEYPLMIRMDRRVVLSVVGRNLTNVYQSDLDQGPDRDSGYVYGPRWPRTLSIGLKVDF